MKFASWLRRKRESLGYSQAFVARNLNVTRPCLSRWENAIARLSYEMLMKIFRFYECSEKEMLELFYEIEKN